MEEFIKKQSPFLNLGFLAKVNLINSYQRYVLRNFHLQLYDLHPNQNFVVIFSKYYSIKLMMDINELLEISFILI